MLFIQASIFLQPGTIIGIYTDVSKIHTLMQWFMKRDDTYTSFRESSLYERLTAREYIQFILKLLTAQLMKQRTY